MRRNLILITGFLLLMVEVCHAQQICSYGSGKLSCSLIKNIVQDVHGFVWIGTENGLNKFDGWTFTSYFHDDRDSTSLQNDLIQCLLCDSQGYLWVGSGNGLQLYCPYKDSFKKIIFLDGNNLLFCICKNCILEKYGRLRPDMAHMLLIEKQWKPLL